LESSLTAILVDAAVTGRKHGPNARRLRDESARVVPVALPGALEGVNVASGFHAGENTDLVSGIGNGNRLHSRDRFARPERQDKNRPGYDDYGERQ
jgi:hypothetical protein